MEELGIKAGIKWPNDIVAHGKKVCGILTEMSAEPDYIHYVVIGCGINVNQMDFPEEIRATATSLALEKGERITRSALLLSIMEHFERAYDKFRETWDLTALLPAYHSYLLNKDARVRVLDPKGEFCGTARGINEAGELLEEKEDGELAGYMPASFRTRRIWLRVIFCNSSGRQSHSRRCALPTVAIMREVTDYKRQADRTWKKDGKPAERRTGACSCARRQLL